MTVSVEVVEVVTDEVVAAFDRLLPQLSQSAQSLDAGALSELVAWPGNRVLVAWVDGVIVDEAARGRGVGAALTQEAVRLANADGARTVDLTSRPSREAANRLYERLGFQLRDSKVYRHAGG